MEASAHRDIDDTRWKIGYSPHLIVIPAVIFSSLLLLIGLVGEGLLILVGLLCLVGTIVIWNQGVNEVNSNYKYLMETFINKIESIEQESNNNTNEVHRMTYKFGSDPPRVEPSFSKYRHTALILTDDSVHINRGDLNLKEKSTANVNSNMYIHDDIIEVNSTLKGNKHHLEIETGGNSVTFGPGTSQQVEEIVSSIRSIQKQ